MTVRVIEALWERIQNRDWDGAGELIAPDAIVDWPVTGERIVGRDNFVAVQREYPEGWTIKVRRIVGQGDQVVSEVDVPHADLGAFTAASFWTVRDGQVIGGTEYWVTPGSEPAPEWRRRYTEPLPGVRTSRP